MYRARLPARFHELRSDFLAFYEKVRELLMSNSIELPKFTSFNFHDAKDFHLQVKYLPEFVTALSSLTECSSFNAYYKATREGYKSDDWEESDATHLREFKWLAVEVLRSFIADSISSGDPAGVFDTFSRFFDERHLLGTIEIQFESDMRIDLGEGKIYLDEKTQLVLDDNRYFLILKDFPIKIREDFRDFDSDLIFTELWNILGKLIVSMILSLPPEEISMPEWAKLEAIWIPEMVRFFPPHSFFRVVGVRSSIDVDSYPFPFWPCSKFADFECESYFFHHKQKREYGPPTILGGEFPKIPGSKLTEVWRQLSSLKEIKGFERRLAVVGRRFPSVLAYSLEDRIVDFCILLESLLCRDAEGESLSYKFALRGALMSSPSIELIEDLRQELKMIYDARSRILHGREPDLDWRIPWHRLYWRALLVVSRTFRLLYMKRDEIKTWDDFIGIVEKALSDRQLQDDIFKIKA
ncbi:MAG: HEPN domain-containing protein [Candidatus Caldarchaeum sp.]